MPMVRMTSRAALLLLAASAQYLLAADQRELESRRRLAADMFGDGILLVHARSAVDQSADGFRQDAAFYYFTGLENTVGAILAIDGRSRESWLFLPGRGLFRRSCHLKGRQVPLQSNTPESRTWSIGLNSKASLPEP